MRKELSISAAIGFLLLSILTFSVYWTQKSSFNSYSVPSRLFYERSINRPRVEYPRRKDMSECVPRYGKIAVFVAFDKASYDSKYRVAQESLACYIAGTNYTLLLIDVHHDERVKRECGQYNQTVFRKHCGAAVYVQDFDWMMVLDADTGVVNPNHCIEEWIDDRVDLIFYERFFNFEIACGNYMVRNSQFSVNFLRRYADMEFVMKNYVWSGSDNGALQILILQAALPSAHQEIENCEEMYRRSVSANTYYGYVTCVKLAMGANRIFPNVLRVYRRGHAWVRDGQLTSDNWSDSDFMFHNWKEQRVGNNGWLSPFNKNLDPALCGNHTIGWDWRADTYRSVDEIRSQLAVAEESARVEYPPEGRILPHLMLPDVEKCYPDCDRDT